MCDVLMRQSQCPRHFTPLAALSNVVYVPVIHGDRPATRGKFSLPPLFRGRLVGVRTACCTLSLPFLLGASSPTRVCTCMVPVCLLALRPFHDDFPGLLPTTGSDGPDSRLYDSGEALELPSVFDDGIYILLLVRASFGGV